MSNMEATMATGAGRPIILVPDVDEVGSGHVQGGVGDIDDARHAQNQGKANGQQGVNAALDQAVDDDVQYHASILSLAVSPDGRRGVDTSRLGLAGHASEPLRAGARRG